VHAAERQNGTGSGGGPEGAAPFVGADEHRSEGDDGVFCTSSFRHFAPLLIACQDYARMSGCRFCSEPFAAVLEDKKDPEVELHEAPKSSVEASIWLPLSVRSRVAAELRAAPAVKTFAERLRAGEPALIEELERSHQIIMSESVRNAMIAAFEQFEMWPPTPSPPEVPDDDCCYQDTSASMPAMAQRAYNDEMRRRCDAASHGGISQLKHRAQTAFFIVDFADKIGMPLPPMPETHSMMLKEFAVCVADWEERLRQDRPPEACEARDARAAFLGGLGIGAAADRLREEVGQLWAGDNRTAGATFIDLVARLNPVSLAFTTGFVLSRCPGVRRPNGAVPPRTPGRDPAPWPTWALETLTPPSSQESPANPTATDELDLVLLRATLVAQHLTQQVADAPP